MVPIYNREREMRRCVDSVMAQDFSDFELILVDDGSTDGSLAQLREITDPRLRRLAHERNHGTGRARNTGVEASRGDWIVFLDSDDELAPGALRLISHLAAQAHENVGALWFRCRMDDGRLSPGRHSSPREWDYAGFVGFWEETVGEWRDVMECTRRRCCDDLPQPTDRMDEAKFLIDFAKRFRIRAYPDVLRLYHQDAENQLVRFTRRLDPRKDQAFIRDRASGFRDLLHEHRDFIAKNAPRLYCEYLQIAATSATMANWRREAFDHALELVRMSPARPRYWILLGASLVGPAAVVLWRWATSDRDKFREPRRILGPSR